VSITTVESLGEMGSWLGKEFLPSPWITVTQQRIQEFADATGDHQWIHVDQERSISDSPFGTTVAHGFLTLSLLVELLAQTVTVNGVRLGVNYGLNRVRFTSPVRSGNDVRARFKLGEFTDLPSGGCQIIWNVVIEQKGETKPCCVAEWITRRFN
jgi:acyl dehydratase